MRGGVTSLPNPAWAISEGCANFTSEPDFIENGFDGQYYYLRVFYNDRGLFVGERITFTVERPRDDSSSAASVDVAIYYTDTNDFINDGDEIAVLTLNRKDSQAYSYTIEKEGSSFMISALNNLNFSYSVSATCSVPGDSAHYISSRTNMFASISRSQTNVTVNNVQSHLSNLSAGIGALTTQNTGFATSLSANDELTYRQGDLRELFNKLSFNSNDLILSTDGDTTGMPDQQRLELDNRRFTIWGQANQSNVDNDSADGAYSGDVWGYNLGGDYRYNDRLTAGVSVGYSETNLTTNFNDGDYDETSKSITPYALYRVRPDLSITAMAGYAHGSINQNRDNETVTSNTNSINWFADILAEGKFTPLANQGLELKPRLGFLFARKKNDGYSESDGTVVDSETSNTRQLRPGIEISYRTTSGDATIQPFFKTDYLHDFTDKTNGDSGAFNIGGGVLIASDDIGWSGTLESSGVVGRNDYSEYNLSGLIAYGFNVNANNQQNIGIASPYLKSNFTDTSGQIFGMGLKFNSLNDRLMGAVDLTHNPSFNDSEAHNTAKLQIDFKF